MKRQIGKYRQTKMGDEPEPFFNVPLGVPSEMGCCFSHLFPSSFFRTKEDNNAGSDSLISLSHHLFAPVTNM